jgi:hypothetical protein
LDSLFKIHYSKTPPKPEAIAKNATLAAPAIQAILAGHPPERNFSLDRVSFDIKDPKRLLTSQLQQFNLTQVAHLTLADLKNDNGNVSGLQQLNTKIMHGTICLPHNKTHSHLQYPPPPSNLHTLSDTLYPRATQKLNGPPQEPTLKFNYPTNSKTASTKNVPTRTHKRDATFDPSDGTITHTLTADTLQIPFQEGLLADEHSWSPANDTYELKIIGVCIHGNGKYATAETAKETVMDLLKHQLPTLDVAESKAFAKQRPRHLPELQLTLLIRRATSLYDIITKTFEPGGLQKAAKLCQNPTSINYPLNPQIVTIYTPCSKPSLQPPITRNRKPIPTHYTNIRGDKYPYHQDLRKYCCTPHLTPVHINISNSRGVITPHPNLPSPHAAQMTEALQNNAGFLDDLPIVTKDSQTPGNGQPCIRFPIAPLRPKERKGYTVEAYAICQDVDMNGLPMSAERQASKTDVLDMATQFTALYVQKPTKDGYIPPETRLFEIRQVISDALPPENPLISPHKNKHAKPDPQKNLAKAHLWLWQKRERGVATGTPTFRSKDQSANIQNPMNRAETTATHYKKRLPPNEIVLNTTTSNPTYGHPGTCSPMKHFHCADTKHLPFSFQVDQRYAGKKVEIELVNMEGVRALQSMSTVELSVDGKFRLTLQFTQVSSEHLGHAIFISDFQLPTNVDAMHSWVLQFLHKILSDATISISGRAGKKLNYILHPRIYTRNQALAHDVINSVALASFLSADTETCLKACTPELSEQLLNSMSTISGLLVRDFGPATLGMRHLASKAYRRPEHLLLFTADKVTKAAVLQTSGTARFVKTLQFGIPKGSQGGYLPPIPVITPSSYSHSDPYPRGVSHTITAPHTQKMQATKEELKETLTRQSQIQKVATSRTLFYAATHKEALTKVNPVSASSLSLPLETNDKWTKELFSSILIMTHPRAKPNSNTAQTQPTSWTQDDINAFKVATAVLLDKDPHNELAQMRTRSKDELRAYLKETRPAVNTELLRLQGVTPAPKGRVVNSPTMAQMFAESSDEEVNRKLMLDRTKSAPIPPPPHPTPNRTPHSPPT